MKTNISAGSIESYGFSRNVNEVLNIGSLKVISGVTSSGKTTESVKSALNNSGDILIVTDSMDIHPILDSFENRISDHDGEVVVVNSNYCTEDADSNRSFSTIVLDMDDGLDSLKDHIPRDYTPHCIITEQIERSDDNVEMKIIEYRW